MERRNEYTMIPRKNNWIHLLGAPGGDEQAEAAASRLLQTWTHPRQEPSNDGTHFTKFSDVSAMVENWSPDWTSLLQHFKGQHTTTRTSHNNDNDNNDNDNDHIIIIDCRDLRMLIQLVFAIDGENPVSLSVVKEVIIPTLMVHLDITNTSTHTRTHTRIHTRTHTHTRTRTHTHTRTHTRTRNDTSMDSIKSNVTAVCHTTHCDSCDWDCCAHELLTYVCSNTNVRYEVVNLLLNYSLGRPLAGGKLKEDNNKNPAFGININIDIIYSLISTAITHHSIGAVRAIIHHDPKVLEMQDASSLTPIHLVFSYGNEQGNNKNKSGMVQLLLEEGKKHGIHLATKIGHHQTQEQSLWTKLRRGELWQWHWHSMIRGQRSLLSAPLDLSLYQLHKNFKDRKRSKNYADEWKCLSLCVQAAKDSDPSFDIVKYILSWRPTLYGFLMEAVEQLDIDLCEKDHRGRTPLLNAILQKPQRYHLIEQLLKVTDNQEIELQPFDRYVDVDGQVICNRHLLHVALDAKMQMQTDLLWRIIYLNPDALQARDPVTGLFPFLQAASKSNPLNINGIYNILRQDPSVTITLAQTFFESSSSSTRHIKLDDRAGVSFQHNGIVVVVVVGLICIFLQYEYEYEYTYVYYFFQK